MSKFPPRCNFWKFMPEKTRGSDTQYQDKFLPLNQIPMGVDYYSAPIEMVSITEHAHLMEEKQKRIEKLKAAITKIINGPEIIYFKENGAMSGKPIEAKEIAREALTDE